MPEKIGSGAKSPSDVPNSADLKAYGKQARQNPKLVAKRRGVRISTLWAKRPMFRGRLLSPAQLRQKLKPHKTASRGRQRDRMMQERQQDNIKRAADRIAQSSGHKVFMPRAIRRGKIDQSGTSGLTRGRSTAQRLALHRDRHEKVEAFRQFFARRIAQAEVAAASKAVDDPAGHNMTAEQALDKHKLALKDFTDLDQAKAGDDDQAGGNAGHVERDDLAALTDELLDIVELQQSHLKDIKKIDPNFDDRLVENDPQSSVSARMDRAAAKLKRLKANLELPGTPATLNQKELEELAALDLLKDLQNVFSGDELSALEDISSEANMRQAAQAHSDPKSQRTLSIEDLSGRFFGSFAKRKDGMDKDWNAFLIELPKQIARRGLTSEVESRALSAARMVPKAIGDEITEAGLVDVNVQSAVLDAQDAADRYTYHRTEAHLKGRKDHLSSELAKAKLKLRDLAQGDVSSDQGPDAKIARYQARIVGLQKEAAALAVDMASHRNSDYGQRVLRRHPQDRNAAPQLAALKAEYAKKISNVRAAIEQVPPGKISAKVKRDLSLKVESARKSVTQNASVSLHPEAAGKDFSEFELTHVMRTLGNEAAHQRALDAPEKSRGRKIKDAIKKAFTGLFNKGVFSTKDPIDELKGHTKAQAAATELVMKQFEDRAVAVEHILHHTELAIESAEAGGDHEHLEHKAERLENRIERIEGKMEVIEKVLTGIELIEHGAGAMSALKNVHARQQVIKHKEHEEREGRELVQDYQHELKLHANPEKRLKYEARHEIQLHLGNMMSHQSYGLDRADQMVGVGQASRHTIQTGAKALGQFGGAGAAGVAASLSAMGMAGAVVFEAGETAIALKEWAEAKNENKELSELVDQQIQKVETKHQALLKDIDKPGRFKKFLQNRGNKDNFTRLNTALLSLEDEQVEAWKGASDDDVDDLNQKDAAIARLRQDVEEVARLRVFAQTLKDGNRVGEKFLISARSGVATAGYGATFAVMAGAGGSIAAAGPVAAGVMLAAGVGVVGVWGYRKYKQNKIDRKAGHAGDAIAGQAKSKALATINDQARARGVKPEELAWEWITSKDPIKRAEILHQDLIAETQNMRYSDAELEVLGKHQEELSKLQSQWVKQSQKASGLGAEADKIYERSRTNKSASAPVDYFKEFNRKKKEAVAAQVEADASLAQIEKLKDKFEQGDGTRDVAAKRDNRRNIFLPGHPDYSETAMVLRNVLHIPEQTIFAMVNAGASDDDPDAAKMSQKLILGHLAGE